MKFFKLNFLTASLQFTYMMLPSNVYIQTDQVSWRLYCAIFHPTEHQVSWRELGLATIRILNDYICINVNVQI